MLASADSKITVHDFANLATELEHQGVAHVMMTYSSAPHAFTVIGSECYRADADAKS